MFINGKSVETSNFIKIFVLRHYHKFSQPAKHKQSCQQTHLHTQQNILLQLLPIKHANTTNHTHTSTQTSSQTLMFPKTKYEEGRMSVNDDGTLIIENVQKSDGGDYICKGLSIAGSAYAKARLEVKGWVGS